MEANSVILPSLQLGSQCKEVSERASCIPSGKADGKRHSRNAPDALLLLTGVQSVAQSRTGLKLLLPEMCSVGMLGPAQRLLSPAAC